MFSRFSNILRVFCELIDVIEHLMGHSDGVHRR